MAAPGYRVALEITGNQGMGAGKWETVEGFEMTDDARALERRLRKTAGSGENGVLEGSGRPVSPKSFGQMLSVRLDASLIGALRDLAQARGIGVSDVVRVALLRAVEDAGQRHVEASLRTYVSSGWPMPTIAFRAGDGFVARSGGGEAGTGSDYASVSFLT